MTNEINNQSPVSSSTKIINAKLENNKNNLSYNSQKVEENHIDKDIDIDKEELKSSKDNSSLSLLREKIQYKQSELNQNKENQDNKKILKEDIIERNEDMNKQFDLKERKIENKKNEEKKQNNNIENNTDTEN